MSATAGRAVKRVTYGGPAPVRVSADATVQHRVGELEVDLPVTWYARHSHFRAQHLRERWTLREGYTVSASGRLLTKSGLHSRTDGRRGWDARNLHELPPALAAVLRGEAALREAVLREVTAALADALDTPDDAEHPEEQP